LKHHFKLYIRSKLVSPLLVGTAHAMQAGSTQHGGTSTWLFYVVAAALVAMVAFGWPSMTLKQIRAIIRSGKRIVSKLETKQPAFPKFMTEWKTQNEKITRRIQ